MSSEFITVFMFATMMVLLMTGQRVFGVIGFVGTAAALWLWGEGSFEMPFNAAFQVLNWYPLITVPFFVFMGYVMSESGVASNLYRMFHVWFGGVNGGLALGTIGLMVLIAAMNGLSVAGMAIGATIALPELLRRFPVGAVYVSPEMFREQSAALDALKVAIDESGTELRLISEGDELDAGDACRLRVLHPPETGVLGSDNANSLVLSLEYAGRRLLFPGDLDNPGLERLLAQPPLDCDVVLAPHHGSKTSSSAALLDALSVQAVLVSAGHRSRFGHPHASVLQRYRERGIAVLQTADSGCIQWRFSTGAPPQPVQRRRPARQRYWNE